MGIFYKEGQNTMKKASKLTKSPNLFRYKSLKATTSKQSLNFSNPLRNFSVRKRSYSFSEGQGRWKKSKKFLLGGNIRDPLNLNSLSDEKVAKVANAGESNTRYFKVQMN